MRIIFSLAWLKKGSSPRRAFKSSEAGTLFFEYAKRISRFMPCETEGFLASEGEKKHDKVVWICDRSAKPVSSEEMSQRLEESIRVGCRELCIVIGGADGLTKEEMDSLKPDVVWSFGPLTLPHELAAVVASEQVYRACTVLNRLPYHLGH